MPMWEATAALALELIIGVDSDYNNLRGKGRYLVAESGNQLLRPRPVDWFAAGKWHLQSFAEKLIASNL